MERVGQPPEPGFLERAHLTPLGNRGAFEALQATSKVQLIWPTVLRGRQENPASWW